MYKFEIYISDDTGMLGTSHDHVPMITTDCERVRNNSQVLFIFTVLAENAIH